MVLGLGLSWSACAYVLSGNRWPQAQTRFVYDLVNTRGERAAPSGVPWNRAFEEALARWNARTAFTFRGQIDPADPCRDDGINSAAFRRDDCGFAFGSTTLAITYSVFSRGALLETDIVFNDNEPWDVYDGPLRARATDFTRVATHELGHALGLGHEDRVPAIMSSLVDDLTLPQKDDLEGVAALYGQAPLPPACQPRPLPLNVWLEERLEAADCRRLDIAEDAFASDDSAVDLYTLDLPVAGLVVVRMDSQALDPYLEIRQGGQVLATDDDSGASTSALIVKHFPPGRYQVVANSALRTLQEGPYRLQVEIGLDPPAPARLESDWSVTLAAVDVNGQAYQAKLAFYPNPDDPHGLYWRLESYALRPGGPVPGAILLPDSTDLVFNPVEALGRRFDVVLKRHFAPQDPTGWYWKLDQVFERH
ncbi:hypothetical protein JCM13664_10620 [Methylothermus subterraneus]